MRRYKLKNLHDKMQIGLFGFFSVVRYANNVYCLPFGLSHKKERIARARNIESASHSYAFLLICTYFVFYIKVI